MQIKTNLEKDVHDVTRQFYLPIIGGEKGLEALHKRAESLTALACPFCGGEAAISIRLGMGYLSTTIRCTDCGAGTQRYICGKFALSFDKELTMDECITNAFNDWQRRT